VINDHFMQTRAAALGKSNEHGPARRRATGSDGVAVAARTQQWFGNLFREVACPGQLNIIVTNIELERANLVDPHTSWDGQLSSATDARVTLARHPDNAYLVLSSGFSSIGKNARSSTSAFPTILRQPLMSTNSRHSRAMRRRNPARPYIFKREFGVDRELVISAHLASRPKLTCARAIFGRI